LRVVGSTATTIEPSSSRNCEHFLEGVYLHCQYKNSLLGRLGRQRELLPHRMMNATRSRRRGFSSASAHSSERMRITSSCSCPWCAARSVCTCHYQGVSHAEWPKTNMNRRQPRPAAPFAGHSKRWSSNAPRPEQKGSHNAQRNYERYLALAQAEAQSGNTVGAENYYQYAEHYFRSMSSDRGAT
jgi:Domain of unknown function (DUF4167)